MFFLGTWYASVCCAFQVDLIKWDPNLWTFVELELVKQAVQLLAIFCKLVRHDPKSSWQLASPNPWFELKYHSSNCVPHQSHAVDAQYIRTCLLVKNLMTAEICSTSAVWCKLKFVQHLNDELISILMTSLFIYIFVYNFFTLPVSTNLTRPTLLYKIERREKNIYVWYNCSSIGSAHPQPTLPILKLASPTSSRSLVEFCPHLPDVLGPRWHCDLPEGDMGSGPMWKLY